MLVGKSAGSIPHQHEIKYVLGLVQGAGTLDDIVRRSRRRRCDAVLAVDEPQDNAETKARRAPAAVGGALREDLLIGSLMAIELLDDLADRCAGVGNVQAPTSPRPAAWSAPCG